MKKFFIMMVAMIMGVSVANAATTDQVRTFFNAYVAASNNFESNVFTKYYAQNPKIIRVVQKKDGTTQSVVVPKDRYLAEAAKGRNLGKALRYKNNYSNVKITPYGKDFKVTAMRNPSPGGSFPAHFIIGDVNGSLKIKEESMNTPRQEFLGK